MISVEYRVEYGARPKSGIEVKIQEWGAERESFCPSSPGGRLAEKWKQVVEGMRESSGGLVKGYVAEKTGVPISALLFNNQLGENDNCGKQDCNPCLRGTTKKLSCRKVLRGGMVYACNCLSCKQAVVAKESWYHGCTARTLYTRQAEHISGWEASKVDNALHKHTQLFHQGEVPVFQFEPEKFFSDATSAQIYEGVSINHTPSAEGYLMNSKAEYQQGEVARVVVVRGLAEWLVVGMAVVAWRSYPGAEPGRGSNSILSRDSRAWNYGLAVTVFKMWRRSGGQPLVT